MSQSDDSFDDSFDDELDQVLNKPTTVNRQIQESIIRRNEPAQRTLMGERLQNNDEVQYEEIHREVTYGPTHHKMNQLDLNTFIYPSNLDMRDYQYDIIVKSFYKNLLCAIPTGMGKTFIASTVMLNYYRWFKEGKIIFMAPTRPLVAQQIQACLGVTDIPSSDTAILLDKTRKNRPDIWNSKRVFFTTPQVVENDLKTGILSPKDVICLVIDEAHRARGNYAYTNVVKFIDRFNTSFRVLALTATPAADIEGVQEVVNNLHISQIEIRTEESIDISKYMKRKETVRIPVGLNSEMEDIIELLSEAIDPILKQANEATIYEVSDPIRINAFHVMQKSQAIVRNPTLSEGVKWKYYYILQVIGFVGQMLRRLKIYGVRTFYSYFQNKCKEFRTKYNLGKSTNKLSAGFFYHDALKKIEAICDRVLNDRSYVSHPKLEHMIDELLTFFQHKKNSRVIVFTELRESALEIVKCIDNVAGNECKAHIFIGQAKAKDGFDEEEYVRKNGPKGRGKAKRLEREEKERQAMERKEQEKKAAAQERAASRTATSEEAQLQGMNQKTQKELIKKFKKGDFNVLVATSIGEEGLDIGEVDLIICYDSTSSPIKNIQRMGRTGRKNDGKVILLLAATEEQKFDQSMEGYSFVQKQIAQNALDMHKSDRIIPKEIQPRCVKQLIDIPDENLKIVRGEDEDEVIKYATQAMLGKNPKTKMTPAKKATGKNGKSLGSRAAATAQNQQQPKITKKFFMPDNVDVGFVKSSKLVRKVGGDTAGDTSVSLDSDGDESDGLEAETSANRSRISVNLSTKKTPSANSSFLQNASVSSPSVNHKTRGAKPTARSAFFRPDFNAVEEPVRRRNSEVYLDSEDESVEGNENNEDEPSKITENTERYDDASADEENFPKALTPEYEKNDFLASSPKPVERVQDDDLVEDSAEEITSVHSDDEDEDLLGAQDKNDSKVIPQKRNVSSFASESKHQRVQGNEALDSLLSFKAFEEDNIEQEANQDNFSYVQPYEEAQKVMEKQYEDDPEFNDEPSFENSEPVKQKKKIAKTPKAKKTTAVQGKSTTKNKRKGADDKVESPHPKIDIASLLKESSRKPKRSLGARRRKVDISTIAKEHIIDLDLESQTGSQVKEVIPRRRQRSVEPPIYLSQKDRVVDNIFAEDDGFLTEEEKQVFFSEYFTHVDVGELVIDPKLAAKNNRRKGTISHSRYAQRFINLIRMTSNTQKLEKSITQLTKNADTHYKDDIRATDVIVGENQIEYVKPTTIKPVEPIEIDDESEGEDSLLDNERPGGAAFTSISLLSDDDEEFKGL